MTVLIDSQVQDALAYMTALREVMEGRPDEPEWQGGLRLLLPVVIALRPDYPGETPVAWLVANDCDGYDLTTVDPGGGTP